jgi:hypothetical protein
MSQVDQVKLAALERLWANVEADLDDEVVHGKFVRFVVDSELYLPAIERYKALAARDPARAALAGKWQKSIADQAAAKVFARAPVPGGAMAGRKRWQRVFIALVLLGLLQYVVRSSCGGS